MKNYILSIGIMLVSCPAPENIAQSPDTVAVVAWIYDGDTIRVREGIATYNIRIIGIDCPESHPNDKCARDARNSRNGCAWQVPLGKIAKKRGIKLLRNQTVHLECDGKCSSGAYGRKLRYVRLQNGRDYGLQMVKDGYCEEFSWKYPHPRQAAYLSAQKTAQRQQKGIWN